jgi:hypothetical protein
MDSDEERRLRRALLGPAPWLIERYVIEHNKASVSGWALTSDGDLGNWCFLVNGRTPDATDYPLSTPSLALVFPFCFESGKGGFVISILITESDRARGYLEITFANKHTRLPTSDHFNQYIDLQGAFELQIPDDDQLFRTQGNRSSDRYKLHGFTTFKRRYWIGGAVAGASRNNSRYVYRIQKSVGSILMSRM